MVKTRALSAKQPTLKIGAKRKRTEILPIKSSKKVCDFRNGDEYNLTDTQRTLRNQSKNGRKLTIDCTSINPNSPSSRENITPSPIPKDSTKELESRITQSRKTTRLQSVKNTTTTGINTIGTPSLPTSLSAATSVLRRPAYCFNTNGIKDAAEVYDAHFVSEMRRQTLFTGGVEGNNRIKSVPMSDKWETRWDTGVQIPCGNKEYSYNAVPEDLLPSLDEEISGVPEEFSKRICSYDKVYIDDNFVKEDEPEHLEYNLDSEDINWFKNYTESYDMENLVISMMSECLNFMEKTCYKESRKKLMEPIVHPAPSVCDGEEICEVCREYEWEEHDKIVFCDVCGKCFHQSCYGIKDITDVFVCSPCMLQLDEFPSCVVCPVKGGALKILDNGSDFCHVSCARYINELKFGDEEIMEPVIGYMNICDSRGRERCLVCDIDYGCTIKCDYKDCSRHFHVECGRRAGFYLTFVEHDDGELTPFALCECHTTDLRCALENTKHAPIRNKRMTSEYEKLVHNFIQSSGETRVSAINLSFLEYINLSVLRKEFPNYDKEFIRSLYEYWKLKRIHNNGRCLLRNSSTQITYNIKTKQWRKTEVLYDVHREENKGRLEKGYLGYLMKSYMGYSDYKSIVNAQANLCALVERIEITKRSLDEEKFDRLEKLKSHRPPPSLPTKVVKKKNQDVITVRGARQSARLDEKNKKGRPKYSPKANFEEIYEKSNSVVRRQMSVSPRSTRSTDDVKNEKVDLPPRRISPRRTNLLKRTASTRSLPSSNGSTPSKKKRDTATSNSITCSPTKNTTSSTSLISFIGQAIHRGVTSLLN
uniref:PHD-type domain-containing protein n=1 Tax=Strongyloides papillosus TaxID=174720 RepID=A0A0N5BW04_STREA